MKSVLSGVIYRVWNTNMLLSYPTDYTALGYLAKGVAMTTGSTFIFLPGLSSLNVKQLFFLY